MPEAFEPILPPDAFRESPKGQPKAPSKSGTRPTEKRSSELMTDRETQFRAQLKQQTDPNRPRPKLKDFRPIPVLAEGYLAKKYVDGLSVGSEDEELDATDRDTPPIDVLKGDREKIAQGKMIEIDQGDLIPGYNADPYTAPDDWKRTRTMIGDVFPHDETIPWQTRLAIVFSHLRQDPWRTIKNLFS